MEGCKWDLMIDKEQSLLTTRVVEEPDNDEISLLDIFAVLWRRRVMIIAITLIAAAGVAAFSVISIILPPETSPLPNEYTPTAHMLIILL